MLRLLAILLLASLVALAHAERLGGPWVYRQTVEADAKAENEWKPVEKAAVERGNFSIHRQLIGEGMADPYRDANERDVAWVGDKADWELGLVFDVPEPHRGRRHIELAFDALDTFAEVYLNGKQVLEADNAFRTWIVPVEAALRPAGNELLVRLLSPGRESAARYSRLPVALPDGPRVAARKVQMQFGWDFAPRMLGSGLRFPLLQSWDHVVVRSASVVAAGRPSLTTGAAGAVACESAPMQLELWVEADQEMESTVAVEASSASATASVRLSKGLQRVTLPFVLKSPALWWCNGEGQPALHEARWQLRAGEERAAGTCVFGVRDIELVREKDAKGVSFRFRLNGRDLRVLGANLVPASAIDPLNTEDAQSLLLARDAGMNLIRVWGGGAYASERTLELCDRHGLMLWQDLPFAGALYPWDDAFLANVEAEVAEQARRLRGHASLAIWCGNNECDEGWWNWGWRDKIPAGRVSDDVRAGYEMLFEQRIPALLAREDAGRAYLSSSPVHGWGRATAHQQGDTHDWGLWHGREPMSRATRKTGRFVSEFGFQSFPAPSTLAAWISTDDRFDPRFASHQRQPAAPEILGHYMGLEGLRALKSEHFAYATRWLQAEAMRTHIGAQRLDTACAGSLVWQMNDPWPGISWSLIDYNGVPKPAYFAVKRAFAKEGVDLAFPGDRAVGQPVGTAKDVRLALLDIDGKVVAEVTDPRRAELTLSSDARACYALAESGPHRVIRALPAIFRPADAKVGESRYTITSRKGARDMGGMTEVTVEAQGVVVGLSFEPTQPFAYPDDALFDLLPGEKQVVRLRLRDARRDWRDSFTALSWHNLVDGWGPPKGDERLDPPGSR